MNTNGSPLPLEALVCSEENHLLSHPHIHRDWQPYEWEDIYDGGRLPEKRQVSDGQYPPNVEKPMPQRAWSSSPGPDYTETAAAQDAGMEDEMQGINEIIEQIERYFKPRFLPCSVSQKFRGGQ